MNVGGAGEGEGNHASVALSAQRRWQKEFFENGAAEAQAVGFLFVSSRTSFSRAGIQRSSSGDSRCQGLLTALATPIQHCSPQSAQSMPEDAELIQIAGNSGNSLNNLPEPFTHVR
jgi:hypothetical protein